MSHTSHLEFISLSNSSSAVLMTVEKVNLVMQPIDAGVQVCNRTKSLLLLTSWRMVTNVVTLRTKIDGVLAMKVMIADAARMKSVTTSFSQIMLPTATTISSR